jgi:septum formation protein
MQQRYILGSESPRRKQILDHFTLPFEQIPSRFNEETIPFDGNPEAYVCQLSQAKADALHPSFPEALIITADTVVWKEGKLYGKPKNREDAFRILWELSGGWHTVFTGVSLYFNHQLLHRSEATRVLFNPLTEQQIQQYHAKLHWADKAGAYAIQAAGGLVIRQIDGCYYNVLGMPINTLCALLAEVGIDLWAHIK